MATDRLYVQFGCGLCAPTSWRNFDASPTLRWEKVPLVGKLSLRNKNRFPENVAYGDIVNGLPLLPCSCAGIYASHVLEHLSLEDSRRALANTLSYLIPGGVFRLVVPDMERLCRDYLAALEAGNRDAVMRLMENSGLGQKERPKKVMGKVVHVFGNSAHRWMWDYAALSLELEKTGFVDLRRCQCADCADPAFSEVEDPARFDASLAIECRKPGGAL
jgi:SAM-dependent methyltransferase